MVNLSREIEILMTGHDLFEFSFIRTTVMISIRAWSGWSKGAKFIYKFTKDK